MTKKHKKCTGCKHFVDYYISYEPTLHDMGGHREVGPYCSVSGAGSLWCFPFLKTKCKKYEQKECGNNE